MTNFQKIRRMILDYLVSNNMHIALDAMRFAESYHQGVRRNGEHEFSHQLEMAQMIISLPGIDDLELVLATCFLHDVREDYGVEDYVIRNRYGIVIAGAVDLLTKEFKGIKRSTDAPFKGISANHIAAIVKGVDRNHNLRTMDGAFNLEKQNGYRIETIDEILPMLRRAYSRHITIQPALELIIRRVWVLSMPALTNH